MAQSQPSDPLLFLLTLFLLLNYQLPSDHFFTGCHDFLEQALLSQDKKKFFFEGQSAQL